MTTQPLANLSESDLRDLFEVLRYTRRDPHRLAGVLRLLKDTVGSAPDSGSEASASPGRSESAKEIIESRDQLSPIRAQVIRAGWEGLRGDPNTHAGGSANGYLAAARAALTHIKERVRDLSSNCVPQHLGAYGAVQWALDHMITDLSDLPPVAQTTSLDAVRAEGILKLENARLGDRVRELELALLTERERSEAGSSRQSPSTAPAAAASPQTTTPPTDPTASETGPSCTDSTPRRPA